METSSNTSPSRSSLLDHVIGSYEKEDRLIAAQIEVTHRCPCKCLHCYLTKPVREEMDTNEIDQVVGQLAEEGVLQLGITGGEPFAREDIDLVLELAHRRRFVLSVQTSGVLLGKAEIKLLSRTGVRDVDMSLLGGTEATHDRIMGIEGSFRRICRAAEGLREAGIGVLLKATLLRENFEERELMAQVARELRVAFGTAALIAPAMDGDPAPQSHMINDAEATEYADWRPDAPSGAKLTCRAGRTFCCITPSGEVLPCTLMRKSVGNVRRDSLKMIWHDRPDPFLLALRDFREEDAESCCRCPERAKCERCPGVTFLETGNISTASPAACRLAHPGGLNHTLHEGYPPL